jgi:hypothetical protein
LEFVGHSIPYKLNFLLPSSFFLADREAFIAGENASYQYFGQFFNGPVSRGRGSPAIFNGFSETSALNLNLEKIVQHIASKGLGH